MEKLDKPRAGKLHPSSALTHNKNTNTNTNKHEDRQNKSWKSSKPVAEEGGELGEDDVDERARALHRRRRTLHTQPQLAAPEAHAHLPAPSNPPDLWSDPATMLPHPAARMLSDTASRRLLFLHRLHFVFFANRHIQPRPRVSSGSAR
eukprot:2754758-Rhodomonas_salina.3